MRSSLVGPRPPSHNNDADPLAGLVEGGHQLVGAVAHARYLAHPQAQVAQVLAQEGRIGIHDLPVEQFVTDCHYFNVHKTKSGGLAGF